MLKQRHIWDKPNLTMLYHPSYAVLDPVHQHIIEHFLYLSWTINHCPSLC